MSDFPTAPRSIHHSTELGDRMNEDTNFNQHFNAAIGYEKPLTMDSEASNLSSMGDENATSIEQPPVSSNMQHEQTGGDGTVGGDGGTVGGDRAVGGDGTGQGPQNNFTQGLFGPFDGTSEPSDDDDRAQLYAWYIDNYNPKRGGGNDHFSRFSIFGWPEAQITEPVTVHYGPFQSATVEFDAEIATRLNQLSSEEARRSLRTFLWCRNRSSGDSVPLQSVLTPDKNGHFTVPEMDVRFIVWNQLVDDRRKLQGACVSFIKGTDCPVALVESMKNVIDKESDPSNSYISPGVALAKRDGYVNVEGDTSNVWYDTQVTLDGIPMKYTQCFIGGPDDKVDDEENHTPVNGDLRTYIESFKFEFPQDQRNLLLDRLSHLEAVQKAIRQLLGAGEVSCRTKFTTGDVLLAPAEWADVYGRNITARHIQQLPVYCTIPEDTWEPWEDDEIAKLSTKLERERCKDENLAGGPVRENTRVKPNPRQVNTNPGTAGASVLTAAESTTAAGGDGTSKKGTGKVNKPNTPVVTKSGSGKQPSGPQPEEDSDVEIDLDFRASTTVSHDYVKDNKDNKACAITPPELALARLRSECGYDEKQMQAIADDMKPFYHGGSGYPGATYSNNTHVRNLKKWVSENLDCYRRGEPPKHELRPSMFVAQRLTHPRGDIIPSIGGNLGKMGLGHWYSVARHHPGNLDMVALKNEMREAKEAMKEIMAKSNTQFNELKEMMVKDNTKTTAKLLNELKETINEVKETTTRHSTLFSELGTRLDKVDAVLGDRTLHNTVGQNHRLINTMRAELGHGLNHIENKIHLAQQKTVERPKQLAAANLPVTQNPGANLSGFSFNNLHITPLGFQELGNRQAAAAARQQQQITMSTSQHQQVTASTSLPATPVRTSTPFFGTASSTTPSTPAKRPLSTTPPTHTKSRQPIISRKKRSRSTVSSGMAVNQPQRFSSAPTGMGTDEVNPAAQGVAQTSMGPDEVNPNALGGA